jgi:hypothetical protein
MTAEFDELGKKAEQGSQQIQGKAAEHDLEELLKHDIPFDDAVVYVSGPGGVEIF